MFKLVTTSSLCILATNAESHSLKMNQKFVNQDKYSSLIDTSVNFRSTAEKSFFTQAVESLTGFELASSKTALDFQVEQILKANKK